MIRVCLPVSMKCLQTKQKLQPPQLGIPRKHCAGTCSPYDNYVMLHLKQICRRVYWCAAVHCHGDANSRNCHVAVEAAACCCHSDCYRPASLRLETWRGQIVYTMVYCQRHLSNRTFISHVWESFMVKKSWLSGHSILLHVSLDSSKLKWWIKFDIKCSMMCLVINFFKGWIFVSGWQLLSSRKTFLYQAIWV